MPFLCLLRGMLFRIQRRGARAPLPLWLLVVCTGLLPVFLNVVQAQRDNFENNLHNYFFPILLLLFSFHFRL